LRDWQWLDVRAAGFHINKTRGVAWWCCGERVVVLWRAGGGVSPQQQESSLEVDKVQLRKTEKTKEVI